MYDLRHNYMYKCMYRQSMFRLRFRLDELSQLQSSCDLLQEFQPLLCNRTLYSIHMHPNLLHRKWALLLRPERLCELHPQNQRILSLSKVNMCMLCNPEQYMWELLFRLSPSYVQVQELLRRLQSCHNRLHKCKPLLYLQLRTWGLP